MLVQPPTLLSVKRGTNANFKLQVTVEPGYHVNSNKPKDEFLIPLKLTWTGTALQTQTVEYPLAEQAHVGGDDLVVFTGKFAISTNFKTAANALPGPALMTGKLSYQACNNQMCFRPALLEVRLPVAVE